MYFVCHYRIAITLEWKDMIIIKFNDPENGGEHIVPKSKFI